MNNVELIGNLARDVEVRYTKTGAPVATYTVATNEKFKSKDGEDKEIVAFINCVSWNMDAEKIANAKKGDRVYVNGRLNTRSYEDNNGNKKYVTEVISRAVILDQYKANNGPSNFDNFGEDEHIPF